ncbi:MAG: hypothetical protein ACR2G7_13590 [Acidimicrobiales bacterium]
MISGTLMGVGPRPAEAAAGGLGGSANGYFSNVSLFGGPSSTRGPAPTVTLPPEGSSTPVTATEASASAVYGPATLFSSGPLEVNTQGTSGSVTSSATIENVNTSGQENLTAEGASSTCMANESGATGSTMIVDGRLVISQGANLDDPSDDTVVTVPTSPAPNTTYEGKIENVGDSFKYVFNEQIVNPDGSITVNAGHQYLLGPIAVGDLIFGQSVCGTADGTSTTTTTAPTAPSTTTTVAGTTPSLATTPVDMLAPVANMAPAGPSSPVASLAAGNMAPGADTTPVAGTGPESNDGDTVAEEPTVAATQAGGTSSGAFGYSTPNVVLFGGAQAPVGPAPTVTLPADGSATPITASAPTGRVAFGPGILFTSGPIDVSTQGTTGPGGSVTSTAHITQNPTSTAGEIVYAGTIDSTCTAGATASGSTTLSGPGDAGHTAATLKVSSGDPDVEGDETYVDLPVNPEPNLSIDGNLEDVGDHFTVVFNEQTVNADGSITVNAVHEKLLGPTLTGDLYLGQVVCSLSATPAAGGGDTGGAPAAGSGGTPAAGSGGAPATSGGGAGRSGGLASTGSEAAPLIALGLVLLVMGGNGKLWAGGRQLLARSTATATPAPNSPPSSRPSAAWATIRRSRRLNRSA